MRDRAYEFCAGRYKDPEQCENESDMSLFAAETAEFIAQDVKSMRGEIDPHFKALAENPQAFVDARAYCFEGYRSAGAKDIRLLGPCLTNAVGGDYFGIVPVPKS